MLSTRPRPRFFPRPPAPLASALLLSASLLTVSLLGVGCSGGHRIEERIDGEVAIPPGTEVVHLSVPSGGITVQPTSDPQARTIRYDLRTLRVGRDAQALERLAALDLRPQQRPDADGVLRLACPELPPELAPDPGRYVNEQANRRNALVVKGVYAVPIDLALVVETARGPIAIVDRRGDVRARTDGGEIRIDRVHGRADLDTANGVVLVEEHHGSLDVESGRGDIFAWIHELDEGGAHLQTVFGNIQVEVPNDLECFVEVRATRGEIENGYDLPVQELGGERVGVKGKIGGGGPRVFLRTDHGNAAIRPSDELRD